LVLECDADNLALQGLGFAGEIQTVLDLLPKSIRVLTALINSQEDFSKVLIRCAEKYSTVQNILIVGHSNRQIMRIAPGFDMPWNVLGKWLNKLRPKKMALIACEAGQFYSTRALFDELPTCRTIYASPFKATKQQFSAIHLLLTYILLAKIYDRNHIFRAQIANFAHTGGIILECTRSNPEGNQLLQFLGAISR
jgi:hypothetical protein